MRHCERSDEKRDVNDLAAQINRDLQVLDAIPRKKSVDRQLHPPTRGTMRSVRPRVE